MKSCQSCKTSKDCNGKPWFSYGEIRWCWHQTLWLIEKSEILEDGEWPFLPDDTGYLNHYFEWTGYASEAYYAKPIETIAEVKRRIEMAGVYGKLLWAQVKADLELTEEARVALIYVSGWRRKRMTFTNWRKQVKQRAGKQSYSPAQ